MNYLTELETAVKRLQKNKENVPIEVLKTKYASAFKKLQADIKKLAQKVIFHFAQMNITLLKEDYDQIYPTIKEAWNSVVVQENQSGSGRRLGYILMNRYDMDWFLMECCRIHLLFEKQAYRDYWLSHCKMIDGRYYSEINGLWYDPENQIWRNRDDFDCVMVSFPPTAELWDRQWKEDMDSVMADIREKEELKEQAVV